MLFTIQIPYSYVEEADAENFYKDEKDYVDTLTTEDKTYKSLIHEGRGNAYGSVSYIRENSRFTEEQKKHKAVLSYADGKCVIYDSKDSRMEDVDSMIDKLVAGKPFVIYICINKGGTDIEFIEEMNQWYKEARNISFGADAVAKKYVEKTGDRNGAKNVAEEFFSDNVPKRDMRISFINKSGKEVTLDAFDCEVERKVSQNRYAIYVNQMAFKK